MDIITAGWSLSLIAIIIATMLGAWLFATSVERAESVAFTVVGASLMVGGIGAIICVLMFMFDC